MDLHVNFEDLMLLFAENKETVRAGKELIHTLPLRRKQRLLRHHDDEAISDRETWLRDEVDDVLELYSLMELACIAQYVPEPLPDAYLEEAEAILADDAVRPYYELNYPLTLPQLHLRRLQGTWRYSEPESTHDLYQSFISLNAMIDDDPDVDQFLWFLEGGWIDGCDMDDVVKVFEHPDKFITLVAESGVLHEGKISKDTPRRASLKRAVAGLRKFLFFCKAFRDLLATANSRPVFSSGLWHFYGYWFEGLREDLGRHLTAAIGLIERWQIEEETRRKRSATTGFTRPVRELLSPRRGEPLLREARAHGIAIRR